MVNLGILAALGAAVAWGSFMVPFKKSGATNLSQYQALISIGIGLSGIIFSLILGYSFNLNGYALFSGLLWSMGNFLALRAIVNLGLSRAAPLLSSLVIISSFLWGVLVFNELPTGLNNGFVGLGLIVIGVVLVSMTSNAASQNIRKGLLAGILAGLLFGSQLVPLKIGKVATADFFFPVCLGILVSGLVLFAAQQVKFKNENTKEGLLSGFIWNIGNLLSLTSLSLIGLAKMGPITQTATLVAVAWGLFYFKEVKGIRPRLQVLLGALVLLVGMIVLSLA